MTPEDRAVFKWIVSWAQGKLSGDKAPSGAAVPAKLPSELKHILKTPTKTKTKRRGQGQRAKTAKRAAAPGSSREEVKAREADPAPAASTPERNPAPAAAPREEDPAPAASTREDDWTTVGPRHRRPKRKRGISTSSPTKGSKDSKRPSAPSQPSQPGKQCYRCQGYGHKSRTCRLPPVCAQCSGDHYSQVCIDARVDGTPPVYYCSTCKEIRHGLRSRFCPARPARISRPSKPPGKAAQPVPAMDKATQCSPAPSPRPAVVDALVGTDEIPEDMEITQPASHAHVDTADAAAQCCIPQPERYLQFHPKHAPLTKHAEYLQDTDLFTLGVASPATVYKVDLGYHRKEPTAAKKTLEHLNQRLPRIVATRTVAGKRKNSWVTSCNVPAARLHHLLLACTLNEALMMSATIGGFKRPEGGQWYEYTVSRSLPCDLSPQWCPVTSVAASRPEHQPAARRQLTSAWASHHDCELSASYVPLFWCSVRMLSIFSLLIIFVNYIYISHLLHRTSH